MGRERVTITDYKSSDVRDPVRARQRARDSIRSDIEFETNINAELKIANLHEKIDRLTESNYQVFVNTQKVLAMHQAKLR